MFFKLYKWHQIAQNLTYEGNNPHRVSLFSPYFISCLLNADFFSPKTHKFFSFLSIFLISDALLVSLVARLVVIWPYYYAKWNQFDILKAAVMEILVKLLWYVNYIIFCTKNSLQNEKKNINHSNAEWHWMHGYITLMHDTTLIYRDTKRFLGNLWPWKFKTFHEKCLWWSG